MWGTFSGDDPEAVFTFTSSVGKISKIEIDAGEIDCQIKEAASSGWTVTDSKLTWEGTPSDTVTLSVDPGSDNFAINQISSFVFTTVVEPPAMGEKIVWAGDDLNSIISNPSDSGESVESFNTVKGITVNCQFSKTDTQHLSHWAFSELCLEGGGSITFTSSVGKISRIEIFADSIDQCKDIAEGKCPGWYILNASDSKLVWTGTPADTVTLTLGESILINISKIVFNDSDLTFFTLNVDYDNRYDPSTKATHVNEKANFTISPISQGEYVPAFDERTMNVTVPVVNGKGSALVEIPTITAGDEYWYQIRQFDGNSAGVDYDLTPHYLHLITDYQAGKHYVVSAQIHTVGPENSDESATDVKIDTVTNSYAEGSLTVSQIATINGEPSNDGTFKSIVTFTLPENIVIMDNVPYGDTAITPEQWKDGTVSVELGLNGGDSVTFAALPDGTTYTIKQETIPIVMGYDDAIYTLDDPDDEGDGFIYTDDEDNPVCIGVSGTVSDTLDTVTISNEKALPVDVGVLLENDAFVILALGALAAGAWLVISKRKRSDYSDAE